MDSPPPADRELDCRGLYCPLPLIKARAELADMSSGEVLALVSTDPAAVADFEAFSRLSGHELLHQSSAGGDHRFWLRKR